MKRTAALVFCCLLAVACGGGADLTESSRQAVTPSSEAKGGTVPNPTPPPPCWDGVTLPRPAVEPTPLPELAATYNAWKAAFAQYELDASAFSDVAAAHAAAYTAAAGGIVGTSCTSDAQCFTGSDEFLGSCHIYYQVGQCGVVDQTPIGVGPQPPPQPVATCADFSCSTPSLYQCALEISTSGFACVLNRCSVNTGGAGGGGGGGGGGKVTGT